MTIANMSPEELRALTPEQMARLIITGQLAHDRATQWDAIKAAHPDDAATLAIANARYLEARYLEACDIAALIRAQP